MQREAESVRINVQLIDAATGYHVWADRYDRELKEVFALQDEVAQRIVSALEVELTESEGERMAQSHTDSVEAYDLFLRGWEQYWSSSLQGRFEARQLFRSAIELDPKFALAYANLAMTYTGVAGGVSETSHERAYELALTAIALDDSIPQVHFVMADVQLFRRQYEEAFISSERCTELDPNYADAFAQRAWLLMYTGKPEEALEMLDEAIRLNPRFSFTYFNPLGETYFTLRRYVEAIDIFEQGLLRNPFAQRQRMFLAASYAHVERIEEAEWQIAELLTLDPDFRLDSVHEAVPYKDPEPLDRLLDGLRRASLP